VRLVRVRAGGHDRWGRIDADRVVLLDGSLADGFRDTVESVRLDGTALLAPVQPSKIVALASNYASHAAEMGKPIPTEPKLFLKAPSALIGPGAPILIPPRTTRVDPEGELALVIGRRLSRPSPQEALDAIWGYTCLNDVTCRDFQKADGVFTRAKGFDTFCPVGPWVETELDPSDLLVQTIVNGKVRASGRTSEMIFNLAEQLCAIASVMTLLPGDVVSTGTPPGVSPIQAGDVVEVLIEGIGRLSNPVEDRDDR